MKQLEFYDIFLLKIEQVCSDSPKTVDEIAQTLSLNTAQLKIWLNHAQQENKIQKLIKPVRYAWVKLQDESEVVQQGSLAL